jgi:hypothetical protein
MTANELADELWEKYLDNNECQHGYALSSGCSNDDCKEQALYDAANMLRQFDLAESIIKQQRLEIEALKDEVAEWKMSYENCHRMCSGYGMN